MSKKQGKKRCEDGSPHCRYKVEQNPLMRINFNTSRENISCFIDQQKTGHKDRLIEESGMSVKKNMRQQVSVWPVHKQSLDDGGSGKKKQDQDFLNDELNAILHKIEHRGVKCPWKEIEEGPKVDENDQNEAQNESIWGNTLGSFEQCDSSKMDYYNTVNYYQNMPLTNIQYNVVCQNTIQQQNVFTMKKHLIVHDPRTTLMIRNIPNKYTINDLLQEIDRKVPNTYDFLYMPCDVKNQCNVGYGFINFINTEYLLQFYNEFNGAKWLRFRSEKICHLTYARLQGLSNLIEHFENSKVLYQRDKKYRPIIRKFEKIDDLIKTQKLGWH